MLNNTDLQQIQERGIAPQQVESQLKSFKSGFPFLPLTSAATPTKGITCLTVEEQNRYLQVWTDYLSREASILKFVPASGAASRMFKDLFEFEQSDKTTPQTAFEKNFFDNLEHFAFYEALDDACTFLYEKGIDELLDEGDYKAIIQALLNEDGLDYGQQPKGLLLFHSTPSRYVTPMEEHLVEGALYAANSSKQVNLHFTVSPEHRTGFEHLLEMVIDKYENLLGVKYNVTFSEQKKSTDTIAANENNEPFREDDDFILFRPGGHGALIANLNELDADIIFIKNIDNVVPDRLKSSTVHYKKLIAGYLVALQERAFAYLRELDNAAVKEEKINEIALFLEQEFCTTHEYYNEWPSVEKVEYLRRKLNRPMRICGMVKNVGEPGGGPFIAGNRDGSASLQILESSQIDLNNPESKAMFSSATHFNPVDLVCAVKDYQGNRFDLTRYVDPQTGFISIKSKGGKTLKALELPGLWNGAMSDWLTAFVEVPIETFNPVKTVNDLLRDEHNSGV